jgi:release factor glutamine methyltransferase
VTEPATVAGATAQVWTVLALLRWTTSYFSDRGIDTARLDAECLLAAALGVDRMRLYLDFDKPVLDAERARYRELVKRRAGDRVPVAQLIGSKEFWSLSLRVSPDVLAPRPDTETLVAAALVLLEAGDAPAEVLDLGTGSGANALALAHERPPARVTATDVSEPALAVARDNAQRLGLADRVSCLPGDLFEPVAGRRFDLIVSNPPYLAESERPDLAPELAHEPDEALFAGADGLSVLRALVDQVPAFLAPGAGFAVEVAPAQADSVAHWCQDAGMRDVAVHRDLAERPRVVAARDPRPPEIGNR